MIDPLDPGADDIERHTTPGFVRDRGPTWQKFRGRKRPLIVMTHAPWSHADAAASGKAELRILFNDE